MFGDVLNQLSVPEELVIRHRVEPYSSTSSFILLHERPKSKTVLKEGIPAVADWVRRAASSRSGG
jgi:hypothetical protein